MTVTIYHNPNCGTSRNVLAMIRESGEEPVVIEYLNTIEPLRPDRGALRNRKNEQNLSIAN
jgi:arsenate reductase-like glutaredoxin family protein